MKEMAGTQVHCTHCRSTEFIKKGTTTKKDGRIFLCKKCRKRFTYSFDDLIGTAYAKTAAEGGNTPVVSKKAVEEATSSSSTASKKTPIMENRVAQAINNLDPKDTGGFDLGKAKRDKQGNLLLRIGTNGVPSPVGASYEDLMKIVNSNHSCTLSLGSDGIFVLKINNTTKG